VVLFGVMPRASVSNALSAKPTARATDANVYPAVLAFAKVDKATTFGAIIKVFSTLAAIA